MPVLPCRLQRGLVLTGRKKYGIPLSSQPSQNTSTSKLLPLLDIRLSTYHNARTDWMMSAASTVTNNDTRDVVISQVYEYASSSLNDAPFSSLYDPSTGVGSSDAGTGSGRAR